MILFNVELYYVIFIVVFPILIIVIILKLTNNVRLKKNSTTNYISTSTTVDDLLKTGNFGAKIVEQSSTNLMKEPSEDMENKLTSHNQKTTFLHLFKDCCGSLKVLKQQKNRDDEEIEEAEAQEEEEEEENDDSSQICVSSSSDSSIDDLDVMIKEEDKILADGSHFDKYHSGQPEKFIATRTVSVDEPLEVDALKTEISNLNLLPDDLKTEVLEKLPGRMKKCKFVALNKSIENDLTEDQKKEEAECRQKQLEDIYKLMKEQEAKLGIYSIADINEQMKLYAL